MPAVLNRSIARAASIRARVLRGRDDHRARGPVLLDHRELDVAGAGRQVDDQRVGLAPRRIDELAERARHHRPAPRQRLVGRDELSHRQHRHAPARLDRVEHLALGGRPLVGRLHQPGLRGAVDVGVDQAGAKAEPLHRDREIGRQRRLADAALAAAHRDQPALGLLRGLDDADRSKSPRPRPARGGRRPRACRAPRRRAPRRRGSRSRCRRRRRAAARRGPRRGEVRRARRRSERCRT